MTKQIIHVGDVVSLRNEGTVIQGKVVQIITGLNPRYQTDNSAPFYSFSVRIDGIPLDLSLHLWQAYSVLPSAEAHA